PAKPRAVRRARVVAGGGARQRRRRAHRPARGGGRRLLPRRRRGGADAPDRRDDRLPRPDPRHRAGRHPASQPVDRGAGDRAGELGVDRARHLRPGAVDPATRVRGGRRRPGRGHLPHAVPPHPAAPREHPDGVRHARHLHHGAARGVAVVPRRGRAAARAQLGRHHQREPVVLPRRPLAGDLPRHRHRAHLAVVQPPGRSAARRPRPGGAPMIGYLAQRLLQAAGVLLGVSIVTFLLAFLLPADPARMIAGRSATVQTVESIRQQLGLDRPLPVQYVNYLGKLLRGDLGRSYAQKAEVTKLIRSRLAPTLQLALAGILFELLIGLPAGIVAALRRGTAVDQAVMAFAFVGVSAPQFVVGLLLIYVFAYLLPLFPLGGYGTPLHGVLPAVAVGLAGGGWYARVTRSAMIDVLRQDYVRTARAKGVFPAKVVFKHVLKNAVLPVVAL